MLPEQEVPPTPEETALNLEQFDDSELEDATRWQRFFNYLIDYGLVLLFTITVVLSIRAFTGVEFEGRLVVALTFILSSIIYYTLLEGLMNGRTIGKLVTRTRAIMDDGSPLTIGKAFQRSYSRLIASRYGQIRHDGWTNTRVVKIK